MSTVLSGGNALVRRCIWKMYWWAIATQGSLRRLGMAYDEDMVNRLRELLADRDDVTEKRMFGGLAFLLAGRMSVAASRTGGLLARVDPAASEALVAKDGVERMVMKGRAMDGWLLVDPEHVRTKRQLAPWVKRSVAFAETLPPKAP